jgi:hypothetical protein
MSDIFRLSRTIYKTAIRHLDNSIVFQFVVDSMAESHPGVINFLWNCFLAVRGPNAPPIPRSQRPTRVYSTHDLDIDFELSPALRHAIISLFKSYYECAKSHDAEFGAALMAHIAGLPDDQLIFRWFELAKAVGPSRDVALRAYRICCAGSADISLFERAIAYLAVAAGVLDLRRVERALLLTFMDDKLTNIGLSGWLAVFKLYCPPPPAAVAARGQWQLKEAPSDVAPKETVAPEVKAQFQNDTTSILALLWNRFQNGGAEARMKLSFVMEAAAVIDDPPKPIAKWKEIRQWILMWKNPEADWSNTVFEGGLFAVNAGWDQELITALENMTSPRE